MQKTADALSGYIPSTVIDKLNEIIEIKSKGQERETIFRDLIRI